MARVPRGQHYGVDRRRPWTSPPSTPVPVAACRCVSACSSGKYVEITFRDGGIYRGEVSPEGKPHGQGRLQSPTADDGDSWVYEGSFKDGKRDGVGVCSWADGYHFEGEFSTGLLCGLGAMWDKGKLEWCGRWVKCEFTEGCAVPLRLIPQRTSLSDAGQPLTAINAMRCCTDAVLLLLRLLRFPGCVCPCLQRNKSDASIRNTHFAG